MAMFRAGLLPLAFETGRYSRLQVPIEDRLFIYCNFEHVETEKKFLMECPLYADLDMIYFVNVIT